MSWLGKLKEKFYKTSSNITEGIKKVISNGKLDDKKLEELEDYLILSDFGPETSSKIVESIKKHSFSKDVTLEEVKVFIKGEILKDFEASEKKIDFNLIRERNKLEYECPYIIMLCGVNGSGKTTTIGKMVSKIIHSDCSVMVAGCDTFRAAAKEQLMEWVQKSKGCHVLIGDRNSDAASIAYKAVEEAKKLKLDIVVIDTAGRLHNNVNLIEELKKTERVLQKLHPKMPQEIILVLDGTTGQNTHSQVDLFQKSLKVTSLIVTKLDGTSKGGSIISIFQKKKIPIYAICVGEKIDDLEYFDASNFLDIILDINKAV